LKDCYRTGKPRKQNMKPETEGMRKQQFYTRKSNKIQESIRQIFEDAGVDMPAVLQKNKGVFAVFDNSELGTRRQQMLCSMVGGVWGAVAKTIAPKNPQIATDALQKVMEKENIKQSIDAQKLLKSSFSHEQYSNQAALSSFHKAANQVFASNLISLLQTLPSGKARRPYLAIVAPSMTRSACSLCLGGEEITQYEWWAAKQHARFPGPGMPVPSVTHSKRKIKTPVLEELLRRLQSPDIFQKFAFGQKIVKLLNDKYCELDAVKLVTPLTQIIFDYMQSLTTDAAFVLDGICLPEDGDRCPNVAKEYGLRCYLCREHSGSHKYTPPSGISPTTLRKIISSLSAGEITSLAGLDDEDAIKGYGNFVRIREIAKEIFELLSLSHEELEEVLQQISDVEVFHKTNFVRHVSNGAIHVCGCLNCGFHSEVDPVPCMHRDHSHRGPCQDCINGFHLFEILEAKIALLATLDHLTPLHHDKIDELSGDLADCKINLRHYRAHLILKHTETKADDNMLLDMKDDEITIICDWKMKILSMFFRETMQQFFGKRGTSCLGFMLISNSDSPEMKNVQFHFFLTDDTTQDAFSVLTAKYILFSNLIPMHVKKVHFRADGAGCFSSNAIKAAMPLWKEWTGVEEKSYRISVSGGGKSNLDGLFGRLSFVLKRAVNRGGDFWDAKTVAEAVKMAGGISACSFHVFLPVRGDDWTTKVDCLKQYTKLHLLESGDILGFFHSEYGSGTVIRATEVNSKWTRGCIPSPPEYSWEPHSPLLNSEENALHTLKKNQVRNQEYRQKQLSENRKELDEKWQAETDLKMKAGLFPCCAVDKMRGCCRMVYSKKCWLDKHIVKNQHSFSSLSSHDYAVALMSEPGALLSPGSNPDRAFWTAEEIETIVNGDAQTEEQEWHALGCYNKPARKESFFKTIALKMDLERMYQHGLASGKTKYTPSSALQELKAMKDPLDPSRLKYSRRIGNVNGPLPTEQIVKQWFAIRSSNDKKSRLAATSETTQNNTNHSTVAIISSAYANMKIKVLKEILKQRNLPISGKNKAELVARLEANDGVEEVTNSLQVASL
jgi:hypothetical protein